MATASSLHITQTNGTEQQLGLSLANVLIGDNNQHDSSVNYTIFNSLFSFYFLIILSIKKKNLCERKKKYPIVTPRDKQLE